MVVYTSVTPVKKQTQTTNLTSSTVLDVLNINDSENGSNHEGDRRWACNLISETGVQNRGKGF